MLLFNFLWCFFSIESLITGRPFVNDALSSAVINYNVAPSVFKYHHYNRRRPKDFIGLCVSPVKDLSKEAPFHTPCPQCVGTSVSLASKLT